MSMRMARGLLISAVLAGCGAGAWGTFVPLVRVQQRAGQSRWAHTADAISKARNDDSLLELAIGRPMFRPGRRPATAAFDPAQPVSPEGPNTPPSPKPILLVSGIVWGDEAAAVVEGLPGIEGPTVLRRGEEAAGIRVLRIGRDRVVLRGLDTTWSLPVREPWK
jgi:hypothetical protein